MFNEERKNKILELLELNSKVTVGELGSLFGVSEVTIRKDLNDLCDSGLAVRTHGGAMARMRTRYEPSQAEKVQEAYPQKRAIAERAAQEIKDGETVMLYGGSTTQELARRLKEKSWKDLTVITNALNIANELADAEGINLIIIGGILRKKILTCVGPFAEAGLKKLVADRVFVSARCVSPEYGLTASSIAEGSCVQQMLASGLRRYLLSHSAKFGENSVYRICGIEDIHVVITDSELAPEMAEEIKKRKCKLIAVPADGRHADSGKA